MVIGVLLPAATAAAGPVLVTDPAVDRAGRTLTTSNGSYIPAQNTYAYGWQRCDAAVASCVTVPGRTAQTYLLSTADIGKRIRSVVAATNSLLGTTTTASAATAAIAASPPLNLTPPSVTGSGSTLTSTLGTWSDPNLPSVIYTRQWQRCSGGNALACQNVSGRNGVTYALTAADDGKFIRVVASAEGLGKASAGSAPLGPIMPLGGGGSTGEGTGKDGTGTPTTKLRKMRPFPKVIIAGRLARGLTFVSGLTIRKGPKGSNVAVRCRGRGCPKGRFRGKLDRSGGMRLRRFQRIYGPGTVIEIRITKRGTIGKFTRLKVRARSVPARSDACLTPGVTKPRRCP